MAQNQLGRTRFLTLMPQNDELGGEGMVFLTEEMTFPCIKIHREVLITEVRTVDPVVSKLL